MAERRPRRIAIWTLSVVGVVAALAYLGVRVGGASDGAQVPFYTDAWRPEGVRVHVLPGSADGLRDGDVVIAISGLPLDAWFDRAVVPAAPAVAAIAPDGVAIYTVLRDDTSLQIPITLARHDVTGLLVDFWSAIVLTVVLQLVAAWVLLRRADAEAAVALAMVAVGVTGSTIPWLLGLQVSDLVSGSPLLLYAATAGGLYMVLWPAGAFHLPLALLRDEPPRRRTVALIYGGPLLAYVSVLVAARLGSPSSVAWFGRWAVAQGLVIVPTVVAGAALSVLLYRRAPRRIRDRSRWALLGGGASLVAGLTLLFLPQLVLGRPLIPWSAVGLVALPLPLGIAASILWSHLFDIEVVVNRALVYGGATVTIAGAYVVSASVLGRLLGAERALSASLVASGLVAVVALPIRDVLQGAVDRMMYGDRDDPYRAISRLGKRLEASMDPLETPAVIVRTVAESMRLPWVALRVPGASRSMDAERTADDALTAGEGRTIEHGRRPPGVEIVDVPLVYGAEVVGDLLVAPRSPTESLSAADRDLLSGLARQVAAAVHSLSLTLDLVGSRERLVAAREEERRRIRRDLHDGLGPTLAAIGMRTEVAADLVAADPAEAGRLLDGVRRDVRAALADIRRLVDALRPPALDELGLVGAIDAQAARLGPVPAVSVVADGPIPDLPAAVEVAAYRIAVEAMTNVVRHADARSCWVRLGVDESDGRVLDVAVADDGRGLPDGVRPGIGILSMRERAAEVGGTCVVGAAEGRGTIVHARLPFPALSSVEGSDG